MNSQYKPQTTTSTTGSFYKTLLALRNTYPPEDDLGIPELKKATAQEHQLIVATRNVRDFVGCGIQVVNPFDNP